MSSATGGGCRRAGSEPAISAQGPAGAIRCERLVTPRDHSTHPQSRKAHPPSRGKLPKQQGQRPAEKRQHGDLPEIATPPQARQAERLDQMDDHCQHQENGNRFRHMPLLAARDAERQSADRHSEDHPISTRIGTDRHRSPLPPTPTARHPPCVRHSFSVCCACHPGHPAPSRDNLPPPHWTFLTATTDSDADRLSGRGGARC